MPDLSPERLHEIMEPVWKKHPGTRPAELEYVPVVWSLAGGWDITHVEVATLLCEAQMTRWLAEQDWDPCLRRVSLPRGWTVTLESSLSSATDEDFMGDTPIEALAAACLAVPEDTT